jgi:uncharacterized protein
MFKYYGSSYIFTAIALIVGYLLGGWPAVGIVAILGILETSLSFDNAVVNASILKNWDEKWRRRFLTWGIWIAVFGMRLVFPLAIVAIATGNGPIDSLMLAMNEPQKYEEIIKSVHHEVGAFGGVFLLMVFLDFFLQEEKDHHWIPFIEGPLSKLGRLGVEAVVALGVVLLATGYMPEAQKLEFLTAGVWGLITYVLAQSVGTLAGGDDLGDKVIKQGAGGFLYIELLDASFSFDGVIAAFALTNNIFIMMVGLAVGAMFVRSMTIHLVEKGTLSQYRYLEHGAFWAIGILAAIMFMNAVGMHVPELVTGTLGAAVIGVALWHSIRANKAEATNA